MCRYMMENPAAGDGGASECLAGRLDAPDNNQNRRAFHDSAEIGSPRFERQIERLHRLGPRPFAELLAEIATGTGASDLIADRVEAYSRLDPEIVRAVGGDRFAPSALAVVR
jgi:hypothetical protein